MEHFFVEPIGRVQFGEIFNLVSHLKLLCEPYCGPLDLNITDYAFSDFKNKKSYGHHPFLSYMARKIQEILFVSH